MDRPGVSALLRILLQNSFWITEHKFSGSLVRDPLPTNMARGPVELPARRGGHGVRREARPWLPLTSISSRSERFCYLKSGCLPEKPLDGRSVVEMP
jgi:hypothetical protein